MSTEVEGMLPRHEMPTTPGVKGDYYLDPLAEAVVREPGEIAHIHHSIVAPFYRSSEVHGRSWEDRDGIIFSDAPLIDEHGNEYPDKSMKGIDYTRPFVSPSKLEPSGITINGLVDAATMSRTIAVSSALRAEGVLTEWPFMAARPKEFVPFKDAAPNGLQTYRDWLYDKELLKTDAVVAAIRPEIRQIPDSMKVTERHGQDLLTIPIDVMSIGRLGLIGQALSEYKFGVMYRGMMSNIRVGEFSIASEPEVLQGRFTAAIEAIQSRASEGYYVSDRLAQLDPEDLADRIEYLSDVLPSIIGENLARFHEAGAYHGFPHNNNWTLAGELVDLDSAMMPSVFEDDEFTPLGQLEDLNGTIADVSLALTRAAVDNRTSIGPVHPQAEADLRQHISIQIRDSYTRYRTEHGGLSDLEDIVLDSHFRINLEREIDLRGDASTRILDILDEDLHEVFLESYEVHLREAEEGAILTQTLMRVFLPVAVQKVEEFFREQNGAMPDWINSKDIAVNELIKYENLMARIFGVEDEHRYVGSSDKLITVSINQD